ncbi:bifunctional diaminohydroxyphosphoribosylaminopyrimidine deaminase/5-amino-6-(5-phosphoribosylamino)uracil reductase RibD [Amphiplicatus metriothermophilus]|uniref:Riboflavin biosynthesis protein RibD n=1 Tax=Amphiplicatus metriothermophilus TaxID=1519374 RepID=A0A239PPY2_9PROT|nr:bifunctional diaminohydroxyphosphoribosylaminopyrimidine deaminase/5-amino-6-(5-phosphoribosylamino)uracil reductase RibD [Amphiplicatus metriothermophilus]MBB5518653.1 diaminohydroxyphosphoribosylaminopyrimidine deaminase/5-amino-6-(5-phosphoribosylamino)uracil reductase [Amphiplicatus metriothermophilus]SNT72190.1 diaminohydroxyphosphoribosylaminopyrimidine deaminase / 5-amino-6-(5-phosphoribosylamino)uracil reductase [Amphiplicatus metriothermophilus]
MADDRRFMLRALELARKGEGRVSPNPPVGCVVAKDGAIVGEGWHDGPGTDHAEAMALKAAGAKARGATVYVTLEPCNHHGRTPPCVDAILKSGADAVVYAVADPNPLAAGGAARLKAEGVDVRAGVCETQARALLRFWLHSLKSPRPYVIAKFATSLDGKIATPGGESKWITGPLARERAHGLRRSVDAVLVGADTVIADDPALTVRLPEVAPVQPLRVVVDSKGRTPPGALVYDRGGRGAVLATTAAAPKARRAAYEELGVDVLVLPADGKGRVDIDELLRTLRKRGLCSVLVEGGGAVLGSFFDGGLIDEVCAFVAPVIIGGAGRTPVAGAGAARLADATRLAEVETERLGPDLMIRGLVRKPQERACSPAS